VSSFSERIPSEKQQQNKLLMLFFARAFRVKSKNPAPEITEAG
jgi:hypothetical protein